MRTASRRAGYQLEKQGFPPHYKLDEPTQEQSTLSVESNYYVESSNPSLFLRLSRRAMEAKEQ